MEDMSRGQVWQDNQTFESIELEDFFSDLPSRTYREERLNAWSHGLIALLAMLGFIQLMLLAFNHVHEYAIESAFVYGVSLVLLFGGSALYHGTNSPTLKKRLRILDHCAIFFFIAGNYTPLLLLTIGGAEGWVLFGIQWAIAFCGILLKVRFTGKYDWFFIVLFVGMAWIGIVQGNQLRELLPAAAFWELIIGGLIYMVGIIFYKMEGKIPYAHLIWHIFVIGGAMMHYHMIVNYVLA